MFKTSLVLIFFLPLSCFSQPWLDKLSKAESLYAKHQYMKALPLAEEAYTMWKSSPDTTVRTKLYIHGVLELIYETTGLFGKAESLYHDDLASLESLRLSGKNVKSLADALKLSLAELYISQGRYDQADFYVQDLIAGADSASSEFIRYTHQKLNASIRFHLGDQVSAERLFVDLLTKRREEETDYPAYAKEVGLLSQNLAFVYDAMGRYRESDSLYQIALTITRNVYTGQSQEYSTVLNNLGMFYLHTGKLTEAESTFVRVLRIKEKSASRNHPEYAMALNNLGLVQVAKGNPTKAKSYFRDALSVLQNAYKSKGSGYMTVLSHLAAAEASDKNFDEADKLYKELLELKTDYIGNVFSFLSEKEKMEFYFSTQSIFNQFRNYVWERSGTDAAILEPLLNLQLRTKGWLFTQQAQIRHGISTSADANLKQQYNQWREKKQLQIMALQDPRFTDEDRSLIEKDINTLEKKISLLARNEQKHKTWRELQRLLKPGEAAVEIFTTVDNKGEGHYGALIFTLADTLPRLVDIGLSQLVEGRNFKFYQNSIRQKLRDENSYAVYWAKIATAIDGVDRIFLSSDGVYQKMNVTTLFNPVTEKYLMDELQVINLTNLHEIDREIAATHASDALLIGYPDYNAADTLGARPFNVPTDTLQRAFGSNGPTLLPGTLKEVEETKMLLDSKGVRVAMFSHKDATESVLKAVQSPAILHIATHGFFLNSESSDPGRYLSGLPADFVTGNPMLRSGLLLAGSGHYLRVRKASNEDGIHTAFEASNLDLNDTRLVVLSACETGLGEVKNGEGVYGLQRAFSVAGAKSVLMSLWKVDDTATQELMVNFYRTWNIQDSPVDAFYGSVKRIKEKYVHPYYWGAFVLSGR